MSERAGRLRALLQKEDVVLNFLCVIMAGGFLALAAASAVKSGDLLTIDNLFFTSVCALLAGIFLVSPALWLHSQGYFRAAGADDFVVDEGPIHFEGSNRLFMTVWGLLLGLTLLEIFLAYIHVPVQLMLAILVGLSVIKAALIMAYFMHLRFERFSLVLTLVPMLIICICLLFVFFPDGLRAFNLRVYR